MSDRNKWDVSGVLVEDPAFTQTRNGKEMVKVTICSKKEWQAKDGRSGVVETIVTPISLDAGVLNDLRDVQCGDGLLLDGRFGSYKPEGKEYYSISLNIETVTKLKDDAFEPRPVEPDTANTMSDDDFVNF